MPQKAIISHRGEKYEIGRGKRFYGIWAIGAPYEAPVDRWPENPDGWRQAWARFTVIEVPGTIAAAGRERKRRQTGTAAVPRSGHGGGLLLAGEGLLVLGVVLGLAGLFPGYMSGQSLLSAWDQVVPHLCYVIGWMVTAALVALSVARAGNAARLGALFGLGLSAVTFGLFLADLGQVVSGQATLGSGLVVSLIGWAACTVGAALALGSTWARGQLAGLAGLAGRSGPSRPGRGHAGPLALLVLAAIGTAAAFVPSWDSYTLRVASTGTSQTITAGNAFANPAMVIAGNVLVMLAVVAVAALAALWRPSRQGAQLLAGAIVPLAAEIPAEMLQAGQQATPAMFGISSSQAAAAGLTISSGLTGIFWVFFVFVISLIVSCAWLFTEPGHPVMPGFLAAPWLPSTGDQATEGVAGSANPGGAVGSEDADSDASEGQDEDEEDEEDAVRADT